MHPLKLLWQNPAIKLATIGLGVLIVGLVGFTFYQQTTFHVVSTEPTIRKISVFTPYLKIRYNKQIKATGLSVSGTKGLVQSYHVTDNDKTLMIMLGYPLEAKKTYSITVSNVSSKDGKLIPKKTFSFVPKNADRNNLTAEQEKALIAVQDKNQGPVADPIISHLPYGTLDFSLSASVTTNDDQSQDLVLNAKLLLSHADMTNQDAAVAAYKTEVTDYIRSIGFDPAKYTIVYTVTSLN